MIFAFSTSSPWTSVAIIDPAGEIVWTEMKYAPMQAGAACLAMLEAAKHEAGIDLVSATGFAADIGPGSFTGVRVGVVLAKTFAFVYGTPVFGADCFDLIDRTTPVVIPSKKGEYFIRIPGSVAYRSEFLPNGNYRGFGPGIERPETPSAANFGRLLSSLPAEDAMSFSPKYLIDPSISTPKKPYRAG